MRAGSLIKATVEEIQQSYVVVSAGLKSEAMIPIVQFQDPEGKLQIEQGSEVEVLLESIEEGSGETRMSREKAIYQRSWHIIEAAFAQSDTIKGFVQGRIKGGYAVNLEGIAAFLPGSLADVRPLREESTIEYSEQEFKIIKLNRNRNNVVVSRRAVLEKQHLLDREAALSKLKVGDVVEGVAKNITSYGVFIDLGSVDGLLHVVDMSWKRLKNPASVVEVGQKLKVKLLGVDVESGRVSLGLKQMGSDPWDTISEMYPEGSQLKGKVTSITDYGCFVEVVEGIEGLVHVSELSWVERNVKPSKLFNISDEVEVKISSIDQERRRISLSIKQCLPNPWEEFNLVHKKGETVTGKVSSITDFGLFVTLDNGLDGLVHLGDLSWSTPGEEAIREYEKGQEVLVTIMGVDVNRRRISLSIRQGQENPFSSYLKEHPKGSIVTGTITEVTQGNAIVDLGDNVPGILFAKEASRHRIEDMRTQFNVGDTIEAKLIGNNRRQRMLGLSIRMKEVDEERDVISGYAQDKAGRPTLGDVMKQKSDDDEEESETAS